MTERITIVSFNPLKFSTPTCFLYTAGVSKWKVLILFYLAFGLNSGNNPLQTFKVPQKLVATDTSACRANGSVAAI